MSLAAQCTAAWVVDPEGSDRALVEVRSRLGQAPDSQCVVLYFSPTVASIANLEDWCALKNLNLSRLLLHFTIRDEPQELPINSGALESAKVRELAEAFGIAAEMADFRVITGAGAADGIELNRLSEAATPGESHCQVTVTADGRTRRFSVQADETVLEAGERAGLVLPYSCRSAVCSTCRTRLVSGSVEMAQNYALEEWEIAAGFILACQSRPTSPELTISYDEQ